MPSNQALPNPGNSAKKPGPESAYDDMREFDDVDRTRELIYSGALEAVSKRFPVEDDEYRLELHNPHYAGPTDFGLAAQKAALMKNRSLQTPISGKWRLVHKPTNATVEEREDVVMQVPYYTPRGTFINNGSEYSVISQARLRPGVYVRKQRTGEIEGHFNVKAGTGRAFRVHLEPKTGRFNVVVGQSSLPLYPLLKGLGVSDKQISDSWGPQLLAANAADVDPRALSSIYSHMAGYKADDLLDEAGKAAYLRDMLPKFELDDRVVARTLGLNGVKGVTPDVLLRTTSKMLGVSRGDEEADDRDSPRFSSVHSVEDLLKERIDKDSGRLTQALLRKIRRAKSLKPVYRNALNPYVETLLRGSLAMPLEETNVLSILEQLNRVTKLGEGGINSPESITDEARDVNPGSFGFVDPITGPECWTGEASVMTRKGWARWDSVSEDTEFACLLDGELAYRKAEKLHVSDYSGKLYGARTKYLDYLVTPNHRIWCRPQDSGSKYRFETAESVCKSKRLIDTGSDKPYSGDPISGSFSTFTLPDIPGNHGNRYKPAPPIDIVTWASFMGWYLSEGSLIGVRGNYKGVAISQQKPDYIDSLEQTLSELPFSFCRTNKRAKPVGYAVSSVQLAKYLVQFGKSGEKYIPEYLFEAPVAARRALMEALCFGDGRKKRETFTYCTVSRRLAADVERLAFTLGIPAGVRFEQDERPQSNFGGCWCVHLNLVRERYVATETKWAKSAFYETDYSGKVYCATVPGGLLYCRHGDNGGHWSGNSEAIGIDVRTAYKTFKGRDNNIYAEFLDAKTGKPVRIAPDDAIDRVVAFPGQEEDGEFVHAMKGGRMQKVPRSEVDYVVPSLAHMFSPNTNLNPMPTSVQAGRQFYGSKFWAQYMPQVQGEVPLVDTLMPDGKSTFTEYYGRRTGTLSAKKAGTVSKVTDQGVTIVDSDGEKHVVELVNTLPFNRLSSISYFPTVKPGDVVNVGDMIAHSNFTDPKTGALNMGRNLKTAIVPFRGASHEDSYVISESAAKKLSTERLFGFDAESKQGVVLNRNKFMSAFPDKFTKAQFETLDDEGVVKPGTVLKQGDPIVVAVGPRLLSSSDAQLGKLHKVLRNSLTDKSQVWEYAWPGTVVDVAVTSKGAKVNVKSTPPVAEGDKLCYSDDTEVLTRGGWKSFKDLSLQDEVAGLDPRTCGVEYMRPESIQSFRHDGDMYKVATKDVDLFVTLNHNLFCDIGAGFELVRADECLGSYKVFATAFDFSGKPGPVVGPSDGKIVGYRGTVYCCTLPKWHVLYVRRNGKAAWCGNSTRMGLKGITGKILKDDEMPRDAVTNEPYDVLLNPMTILSRVAPNQIMELALGKIAAKTGKQIRIPQLPPKEGWANWVKKQMDEAGVSETSDVFDPVSGKTIKGIGDGTMFVSAFHHLAEKKMSARGGSEAAYNSDEQPAHGGFSGGKKFSSMDVMAALSHGSTSVIKDVITVRGTKNEEFWKALKLGQPLPEPGVPFIYDKFLNSLRAGGINVVEKGDVTSLLPMTDDDVMKASKGAIESSDMVDSDFEPRTGGMFDVGKTGGMSGKRWTHYDLPEPIPNPVMEEPIRRLLGLKVQQLEDVIAGRESIDGKTGGQAIKDALSKIDIDKKIEEHKQRVRTARGANRDNSAKILGYLASAKKNGIHPSKWVISKMPILPPAFRPVSRMGDVALVADINELYRDVIESSAAFKELRKDLPDSSLADERLNIYGAVKAAYGLGESITPEGQSKRLKGAIRQVIGTSPKSGMWQSKVFSKPVDVVGRGVAAPDPNLDMDQIGIPEDSAWVLYKDFALRNLVRHGYPAVRAAEMVDKRTPEAKTALEAEMAERPVIMDRAPTLHKFNLMGFYPHIAEGNTVRVSPLACKGFNLDFDGDSQLGLTLIVVDNQALSTFSDAQRKKVEDSALHVLKHDVLFSHIKEVVPMFTKSEILASTDGVLCAIDLEDFPHGELVNVRKDDQYDIEFYAVPDGIKVPSYDPATGEVTLAPVKYWSIHRGKAVEIVNLENGSQIYTDDDPRAVFGIGADSTDLVPARYTPTAALSANVLVPCALATPPAEPGTLFYDFDADKVSSTASARSVPLDYDFGQFVGVMAGDGWADVTGSTYLADNDGHNMRFVSSYMKKHPDVFGEFSVSSRHVSKDDEPDRYGDTTKHTFNFGDNRQFVANALKNLFDGHRDKNTSGSANKRLPGWFQTAPAEFVRGIVNGIVATDGSISVSHAKDAPQLLVSVSSTSLRLVREVRRACQLVGVKASITYSKRTTAGNDSWLLNISTVDAKRSDLFANCCHVEKRKTFVDTSVRTDDVMVRNDVIPFPACISSEVLKFIEFPKCQASAKAKFTGDEAAWAQVKQQHAFAMSIYNSAKRGVITRNLSRKIVAHIEKIESEADAGAGFIAGYAAQQSGKKWAFGAEASGLSLAVSCISALVSVDDATKAVGVARSAIATSARSGFMSRLRLDRLVAFAEMTKDARRLSASPVFKTWKLMIDASVSWSPVESVHRTNKVETGYDLTVPGFETFMSAEGVILSNTVNFHVPVSDKAVQEVKEKMLPSSNLFSLTDLKSPRYSPTMEMTSGLHKLTDKPAAKPAKVFRTRAEAIAAYRAGEVGANDPVEILEMK